MSGLQLQELRNVFQGRMLTADVDIAPFVIDWRGHWRGASQAVVQPNTTEDVAAVVAWCHTNQVPLVPQGGNTGLSGGAVPDTSGTAIVLSLSRLKKIRAIDTVNNTMSVEAGCVLQEIQTRAREVGRLFPLSLAAEGSCTIGGNLATNAGGTAVLRYGNVRELCLGLEVVTAQGKIWDGMRGLRKDNSGFDLRDVFIGSEGTLGVITGAVLKLFPLPAMQMVALVAVDTPAAAVALLTLAKTALDAALTAFELISRSSLELVFQHFSSSVDPFANVSPWYVLIELSEATDFGSGGARFEALLEVALETGVVTDGVVATSIAQAKSMWALRENISEAQAHEGACIKHDISIPISSIASFIEQGTATLAANIPNLRPVIFGHLGDGNLHFNISATPGTDAGALLRRQESINRTTHDLVAAFNGSISAEHGIGVLRRDEVIRYKSTVELDLMKSIKNALDPLGIMNPNKVLRA